MLLLLSGNNDFALKGILASICTIIGIAGFGYLTNDLGDRNKDKIIQKENVTCDLSNVSLVLLFVLFLSLAIAPWFYFPMRKWSYLLLFTQFFLFYIYAFPPFRFKEKGVLGVVVDSLYAHVNPAILAAYTFYLFTEETYQNFVSFIIFLGLWQFFVGIRGILFHQHKDYLNDINSGTKTFVTSIGKQKVSVLLKYIVLPIEAFTFILFASYFSFDQIYFLPIIITYWCWIIIKLKLNNTLKKVDFRSLAYQLLDNYYTLWIPVVILLGLVSNPTFNTISLLILHTILFKSVINLFFNWLNNKYSVIYRLFKFESWIEGAIANGLVFILYTLVLLGVYIGVKCCSAENIEIVELQLIFFRALILILVVQLLLLVYFRFRR